MFSYKTTNRTYSVSIHNTRYKHSYKSQSSFSWGIRMNITITNCCHSSKCPIQTENIFGSNWTILNTTLIYPAIFMQITLSRTNIPKETRYPMCNKSNQYNKFQEFYKYIKCFRSYIFFKFNEYSL
jgi:hypothetical protein